MKKILYIFMVLMLILISQLSAKDNIILTASYNKNFFSNNTLDMYGLNLEIFITKNVSINYSLMLGSDGRNLALHTTGGVIGGINMLGYAIEEDYYDDEESSSGFIYGSSVIMMILPEGINIHVPLSQYVSLVPYIHPLGYDYIGNDRTVSSSVGLKVMYNINDKIVLIPQAGVSLFYSTENHTSYNLGLSVGVKL
ncbi:MAG: hypothetical protein V1779_11660 [bacterium]